MEDGHKMLLTRKCDMHPVSNDSPSYGTQFSKCLILAISSIGLGWLLTRLWRGVETAPSAQQGAQISLFNNQPPFLKTIELIYQRSQGEGMDPCGMGLALGGAGSILSLSPAPLALGSLMCLPSARAQSTIPDSVFAQQKRQNIVEESANQLHRFLWIAAGARLGGIKGAVIGEGMGSSFSGLLGLGPKNFIVRDAIRSELNGFRIEIANDPNFAIDPMQVRMKVSQKLLHSLNDPRFKSLPEHELLYVKEYLFQTQQMLGESASATKALANTLENKIPHLSNQVRDLGSKYERAAAEINELTGQLGATQVNLSILTANTEAAFNSVYSQIKGMSMRQDQMAEVTNFLVQEALLVSTRGFESDKKIMNLEKELRKLESENNLSGTMNKVVELKKAIQAEEKKRLEFDQTLQGIGNGFQLVSLMAAFGGNPKLAHQISTIGQSAITISTSVAALAGVGAAGAAIAAGGALAVLGPVGAIAGAVFAIFSLFNSGPSIEEQIYEAVQKLAEALGQVRKEMHERFDHVEEMIKTHHEYTALRFDRLEQMLEKIHENMHLRFDQLFDIALKSYKNSIDQFISLKDDVTAIREMAGMIQTQLNTLQTKIDSGFQELYRQPYQNLVANAIGYHKVYPYPNNTLTPLQQSDYLLAFTNWAKTGVTNKIMANNALIINFEEVAKSVRGVEVDFNVQSLAHLAQSQFGLRTGTDMPNPSLWVKAVDNLLEFLWRTPEFQFTPQHRHVFEDIRQTGARFQQFVISLQSSPMLYQTLAKHYEKQLAQVQEVCLRLTFEELNIDPAKPTSGHDTSSTARAMGGPTNSIDILSKKILTLRDTGLNETLNTVENWNQLTSKLFSVINEAHSAIGTKTYFCRDISQYSQRTLTTRFIGELSRLNAQANYKALCGVTIFDNTIRIGPENLVNPSNDVAIRLANAYEQGLTLSTHLKKGPDEILKLRKQLKAIEDFIEESLRSEMKKLKLHIDDQDQHLAEERRIQESDEQLYLNSLRTLKILSKMPSDINHHEKITFLKSGFKALPKEDSFYTYLLHHLSEQDRKDIKRAIVRELDKPGSPLNIAIQQVDTFHVLLEAYTRLGFEADFHHDYRFRSLFETIWSADSISHNLRSWNVTIPETFPYIQIEDHVLPALEDFQADILDRATTLSATRDHKLEVSLQTTGYTSVDEAQTRLHLVEAIFIDHPVKDEL